MISRRSVFTAVLAGLITSSCTLRRDPRPWHGTFEKFRPIMRTLATGKAVAEKFGDPERWDTFNPEATDKHSRPGSREEWQELFISEPPGLIATMPVGTTLMAYHFSTIDALNPTGGAAYACVNDSDKVIGWLYTGFMDAYPKEMELSGIPHDPRYRGISNGSAPNPR